MVGHALHAKLAGLERYGTAQTGGGVEALQGNRVAIGVVIIGHYVEQRRAADHHVAEIQRSPRRQRIGVAAEIVQNAQLILALIQDTGEFRTGKTAERVAGHDGRPFRRVSFVMARAPVMPRFMPPIDIEIAVALAVVDGIANGRADHAHPRQAAAHRIRKRPGRQIVRAGRQDVVPLVGQFIQQITSGQTLIRILRLTGADDDAAEPMQNAGVAQVIHVGADHGVFDDVNVVIHIEAAARQMFVGGIHAHFRGVNRAASAAGADGETRPVFGPGSTAARREGVAVREPFHLIFKANAGEQFAVGFEYGSGERAGLTAHRAEVCAFGRGRVRIKAAGVILHHHAEMRTADGVQGEIHRHHVRTVGEAGRERGGRGLSARRADQDQPTAKDQRTGPGWDPGWLSSWVPMPYRRCAKMPEMAGRRCELFHG
ncbi:MAG: hypothetical protein BWX84_02412 [Verrucomicrobia bacterium ADurb.Bin118]|nr:MAG: hypothetical protein BWX84_02412 [Verrucomicrobia bacterium ADurb.Bin118]